LRRYAVE